MTEELEVGSVNGGEASGRHDDSHTDTRLTLVQWTALYARVRAY